MGRSRQVTASSAGGVDSVTLATRGKKPTYSAYFPADAILTLADIAPGWNGRNGFFLVRYVATTLPGSGSNYLASINSGSSADIIGFRLEFDTPNVEMKDYWRMLSTNYAFAQNKFHAIANEPKTWAFGWREDGFRYTMIDDQYTENTNAAAIPAANAFTTMTINGRNGGSEKFTGNLMYVEFFDEFLSKEEAIARRGQVFQNATVIATAGQSNIQNWEDGVETTGPAGRTGIVDAIGKTGATVPIGEIVQVHAAEGGSGIWADLTGTAEYWLTDGGQPGPELLEFFTEVDQIGKDPDYIFWDQGETESHKLEQGAFLHRTRATYKADLLKVFQLMRAKYPNTQILIGKLGIRTTFTNQAGIQWIIDVQNELVNEHPWIHFGWERYDLALNADGVHYDDAEYAIQGQRAGRRVAALKGFTVAGGTEGPRLVSCTRAGTTLTINIEHDGGTDFTPTTGIEGFYYRNAADSGNVALSAVNRTDATTITATLASAEAGTLYYMYNNETVNLANLLKDNGANTLPLQRNKVSVA